VAWQWQQREGNGSGCGSVIWWRVWTTEFIKTCNSVGASNSRCKVCREARGWPGVDGGAHEVRGKRKKKRFKHAQKMQLARCVVCAQSTRGQVVCGGGLR